MCLGINARPIPQVRLALPVLVLSSIVGVSCPTCTVSNPLLTFNVNVRAGRAYTCYIIGNPWSGLFRAYVLED